MRKITSKEQVFNELKKGAIVITPNNRLSSHLLHDYFKFCNHPTIDKPRCQPYTTLLTQAFAQLHYVNPALELPTLFTTAQCQHLWRTVLASDQRITYSEGLLSAVMEAWTYCQQWAVDEYHEGFNHTPQTRTFQQWWQEINRRLAELNAISEYQIIQHLIDQPLVTKTSAVIWACFDGYNPQQQLLQQHLQDHGVAQYQYDLATRPEQPALYAASDDKNEYQQLIAWLRQRVALNEQRIGVVIPGLQNESRQIQRLMLEHFPDDLFNVSLGAPLIDFPLASHALSWLRLEQKYLSSQQIALLLQSPYIAGSKTEFVKRSHFLQESTLLQKHSVAFTTAHEQLSQAAPKLAAVLTKLTPYPPSASLAGWIELFQQRLNQLGFPGEYSLNSENYQCFNRFSALFDEFRQLANVTPILKQHEALNALNQLCAHAIFQAQKTSAIIHISGLLEAAGCEFDSLWVMGLTDQCLPQKTRLSAFIPLQLQRELGTPHSTPERELALAQSTLHRLSNSATEVVYSYPQLKGDSPNLPCALFNQLPDYEPLIWQQANQSTLLEQFDESYLLPLAADEHITGGTSLLANQAKCPFKAFAQHRLTAKPIASSSEGVNAQDKGKAVHKIMELLWQQLQSQKRLLCIDHSILDALINEAIARTLSAETATNPLLSDIETSRLKRLVLSCLEWEKQRSDFAVLALEASYTINLAGLTIEVRVDRLDQCQDKKWVIDYKSSLPATKPWNEERPTEPQLLLYALLDQEIETILLLQVKTGNILCSGLSAEKVDIRGISGLKKDEQWSDVRDYWQQQLTGLAQEIKDGHCLPQPANISICQQCDISSLCRFGQ